MDAIFALLDDADATAEHPTSRLYTGFAREHRCTDPMEVDGVCSAALADLAGDLHAVLLADYEWGAKLLRAGCAALPHDDRSSLRVLMFRTLERLDAGQVASWLARAEGLAA